MLINRVLSFYLGCFHLESIQKVIIYKNEMSFVLVLLFIGKLSILDFHVDTKWDSLSKYSMPSRYFFLKFLNFSYRYSSTQPIS